MALSQRLVVVFNVVILVLLFLEHQTILPNTKTSIENSIKRLMEESQSLTTNTIESLQNDVHSLMEDAGHMMQKKQHALVTPAASNSYKPKSQAKPCSPNHPVPDASLFQSQNKEDLELLPFFGNLCNGTYIEMGGHNGIRFSNSHVFAKGLGWRGVLVEASPNNYQQMIKNRPNELANVHAGVCSTPLDLHFVTVPNAEVGGFLEFTSLHHQRTFFTPEAIARAQKVPCKPLQTILEETVGTPVFFDFFSLDIEGAEYAALQSLDFSQVQFGILLVEADGGNLRKNFAIRALLEKNGYTFFKEKLNSYWFYNNHWADIYGDLIYLEQNI